MRLASVATKDLAMHEVVPRVQPTPEYVSWGRYPRVRHDSVFRVYWTDQVGSILAVGGPGVYLAYGLGRSYGDSCLNAERSLIDCSRLNRILAFDRNSGRILCEAGVSLADILEIAVPADWFLPVTPGTKFVTLGGAIANDVHGKNHHKAATFGVHVTRLFLCRSDGGVLECNPHENQDLFRATIGGLGLTGVILAAEVQLKPIAGDQMEMECIAFQSIGDFEALADESDGSFEYTVAWVDSFSAKQLRGIFIRGNHASGFHHRPGNRVRLRVPSLAPTFLLNRYTGKLFNEAYYRWNSIRRSRLQVGLDAFFYPLDAVRGWNRLYGPGGFLQYQFVLPLAARDALELILAQIARDDQGSFLAVLKRFGGLNSPGMMSFPRAGFTLALDFPMRGERTLQLLEALDEIVIANGGAVYPAKDARMSPRTFAASFPAWREFARFIDPVMSSSFWRRVIE